MCMKSHLRFFTGPVAFVSAAMFLLFTIPDLAQQPLQVLQKSCKITSVR
jgi:hypothetical protein